MNIEELRRLEQAATPREWLTYRHLVRAVDPEYTDDEARPVYEPIASAVNPDTAALIAAARNALPALLRVAEAARKLAAGPESTAWDELYAAIAALEAAR